MKKRIALLLALVIGFAFYPSGVVVMAAGNSDIAMGTEEEILSENQEKKVTVESEEKKTLSENKETKISEESEKDKKSIEAENSGEKSEDSFLDKLFGNLFSEKETSDGNNEKTKTASKKEIVQETNGLENLQIPQKLNVVIDPWEMDQKGQVYSEEYTIGNTGDMPGILTLSRLTCRPRERSGVVVRTDKAGLHDTGDKCIYMEMLLGTGERIIFSQESSQYQKELKPGEKLSICFTGEVNENAFGKWENNDVEVSVVYSWEIEKTPNLSVENQKEKISDEEETEENIQLDSEREVLKAGEHADGSVEKLEKADLNQQEPGKVPETDIETGKSEADQSGMDETDEKPLINGNETQEPQPDVNEVQESSTNGSEGVGIEQSGTLNEVNTLSTGNQKTSMQEFQINGNNSDLSEQEKDEIKNIDLLEPQEVDVVIDSWKTDEKGRIVSPEYLLYNIGDTIGIWTLSKIVCESQEQSRVEIQTEKDELCNAEEKSVYMELVIGNAEKMVLSQSESQYKVELKPGEKLSVRFVGEMHGNLFENREDGEIAVIAVCNWTLR